MRATATVTREIAFPVEKVWTALADFGNAGWIKSVQRVEAIGSGVGMRRRMHVEGIPPFEEVLESLDSKNRLIGYGIPHGIPLPADDYHATIRLEELPGSRTRIIWSGGGIPKGVPPEAVEQGLQGSYSGLIDWLEAHLATL